MKRKRKRLQALVVPRLGPAVNLRPAGAHETNRRYHRRKAKIALRRELAEGDGVS